MRLASSLAQLSANTTDALLQTGDAEAFAGACTADGLEPAEYLLQLFIGQAVSDTGCIARHPALTGNSDESSGVHSSSDGEEKPGNQPGRIS